MKRPDLIVLHILYCAARAGDPPHRRLTQLNLPPGQLRVILEQLSDQGWVASVRQPSLTLQGFAVGAALTRRALETGEKAA